MFRGRGRNWHHGHSLATGAGVGLLVSYRPWIIFAAGILLGIAACWTYRTVATLADHWIWKRKRSLAARPMVNPPRRSAQTDEIPF